MKDLLLLIETHISQKWFYLFSQMNGCSYHKLPTQLK